LLSEAYHKNRLPGNERKLALAFTLSCRAATDKIASTRDE
jgi:hypothetical protein